MTTTRLIFVVGPERTGTRLTTRALMHSGASGNDSHFQPFDQVLPLSSQVPLVWRRSYPHAGEWTNLSQLLKGQEEKYEVRVVTTSRYAEAAADSQVSSSLATSHAEALERIQRAYSCIFTQLASTSWPVLLLQYSDWFLYPARQLQMLCMFAGLPLDLEVLTRLQLKNRDLEHPSIAQLEYEHWCNR